MTENQNFSLLDEQLLLGIPVIDRQHVNLMRITNNLHLTSLKSSEIANFRFIQAVHEAVGYLQYHFKTEEKLMLLLDFSEVLSHRREHEQFIWEIMTHSECLKNGDGTNPKRFVLLFNEWLNFHIGTSDKAFADFFLNMKNYGKLKMTLAGESLLSA
jgi:hemerythrin